MTNRGPAAGEGGREGGREGAGENGMRLGDRPELEWDTLGSLSPELEWDTFGITVFRRYLPCLETAKARHGSPE